MSLRLPFTLGASALTWLMTACLQAPVALAQTDSASPTPAISDQDISDAYIYLYSRLLVARQQQLDFKAGMQWNTLTHHKPGAVDWPNPNLDVAYSEAWVAVDKNSCTLVSVPKISGRYYTVQFLNGWGETLANINEREFPKHPNGEFAACLQGAKVKLPANTQRVDLPARTARVLTRVELGSDWSEAERLQHQFTMRPTGSPQLPQIPQTLMFQGQQLPGVEAFDSANVALQEPDLNPGMEPLQAKVHAIAAAIANPEERARIDKSIHTHTFADLAKASPLMGHGTASNGWGRPATSGTYGSDYLTRTLVNYGGIWANTQKEVVYYRGWQDENGKPLDSAQSYSVTFPADQLPASMVNYYWSITATDSKNFRVLPNPQNRFAINSHSPLMYNKDGSLTLHFAPTKPQDVADGNWLPTSAGQNYRLIFRFYGAKGGATTGEYVPPVIKHS
ncbi:hypothetical protein BJ917_1073 [Pseudomonas sp. WPR_5_2]|uniref:DUF1214 domain-containing protein n=1 Tax=Pseudomonas sp. WPR_5_2 TaxID=1907371 RepID=UPI000EB09622|nr:DUF1214 domain-containing protein [Pseudomonas sp. WPR_5_2]RKS28203.1 hypothetical protein BJ917_1073 [Pseudomonas sp. WPR_5_2]